MMDDYFYCWVIFYLTKIFIIINTSKNEQTTFKNCNKKLLWKNVIKWGLLQEKGNEKRVKVRGKTSEWVNTDIKMFVNIFSKFLFKKKWKYRSKNFWEKKKERKFFKIFVNEFFTIFYKVFLWETRADSSNLTVFLYPPNI